MSCMASINCCNVCRILRLPIYSSCFMHYRYPLFGSSLTVLAWKGMLYISMDLHELPRFFPLDFVSADMYLISFGLF